MINEVRVAKTDERYLTVWHYEHYGIQKVHPFNPGSARQVLHVLEILTRRGYPTEPVDMIEQLKVAIKKEDEDDERYFSEKSRSR